MAGSIYESHKNGKFVAVIELFSGVSSSPSHRGRILAEKMEQTTIGETFCKLSESDLHILYGKDL